MVFRWFSSYPLFIESGTSVPWDGDTHLQGGSSLLGQSSVGVLSQTPLVLCSVSAQVIVNPVKLTIEINGHNLESLSPKPIRSVFQTPDSLLFAHVTGRPMSRFPSL